MPVLLFNFMYGNHRYSQENESIEYKNIMKRNSCATSFTKFAPKKC